MDHAFEFVHLFDFYEDYENVINELDDTTPYVIYCSGETCSLSMDLADYFFNELAFENILIFEAGWTQWRDADLPSSLNITAIIDSPTTQTTINLDDVISWITLIIKAKPALSSQAFPKSNSPSFKTEKGLKGTIGSPGDIPRLKLSMSSQQNNIRTVKLRLATVLCVNQLPKTTVD